MPADMYVSSEKLIEYVQDHFSESDVGLVKRACDFAEHFYAGIKHPTGKSYTNYTLAVAQFLADLGSVPLVIAAATIIPPLPIASQVLPELNQKFKDQDKLVMLVKEILSLTSLEWDIWSAPSEQNEDREQREILRKMYLLAIDDSVAEEHELNSSTSHFQKKEKQVENLIGMFMAATDDILALIIKLADRLHFIKLLKDLPPDQQKLICSNIQAKITLEIYAPLADRSGLWRLKSGLEDMSFRLLDMEQFKAIVGKLAEKKDARKRYIDEIIPVIREELTTFGVKAEISGRAKHIYSIYQKMQAKQLSFEQINDLLGLRIIVENKEDCYKAQGILHAFYSPVTDVYAGNAGRDWIANPKANLYQSLHTTVEVGDKIVEVQIRTRRMHETAEYGIGAAHWQYKESKAYRKGKTLGEYWMKDRNELLAERRKVLNDEQQDTNVSETNELTSVRIYVITPEGHVIDLPKGATPLDFAYRIHTDLGHRYTGAKVGGHIVRVDYKLKNGEIVELITSRPRSGPNPDWLAVSKDEEGKRDYLFARTPQARSKINHWFNAQKPKQSDTPKSKQNDIQKPGKTTHKDT
jgi:GTP diphosphokinase / guanosine-3',5'-bis(diphosphate) 3'-diphosphatase